MNKYLPWIVCLSSGLFFAFTFLQMNLLNSLSIILMKEWQLSAQQFSNLAVLYLLSAAIFFIPTGILLDRFSIRKSIIFSMGLCTLSIVLFALTKTFFLAKIARFIMGSSYCVALLSCFKLVNDWFEQRIALAFGTITTLGLLGGVAAQTPIALLNKLLGWRQTLLVDAILGVIILMILWVFISENPQKEKEDVTKTSVINLSYGVKKIYLHPINWECALYACLLNTPILYLGDLWGNLYLSQVYGFNNQSASYISTMIFIGTIAGCPTMGWLSDCFQSRRVIMMVSAILLLPTIAPLFFDHSLSFYSLAIMFFVLGFLASAQVLIYPLMGKMNASNWVATATGFTTTLIMLGNAFLQKLFAKIISFHHSDKIYLINLYTKSDYLHALSILPIAFLGCFLVILFLKES